MSDELDDVLDLTGDDGTAHRFVRPTGWKREVPVVTLDAVDMRTAHAWGDEKLRAVVASAGPVNYTGLNVAERFTKGYLGEVGCVRLCERLGVRCVYEVRIVGRRPPPELTVFVRGCPWYVDVKTAGRKEYSRFMVPLAQPLDAAFYVGTRLRCHGEWLGHRDALDVEGCGWLRAGEVAALPTATFGEWGVVTRHCQLEAMHDLTARLAGCDRGPVELVGRARDLALRAHL